jgi:uncharacterized protein (TIGR00730 family)
VGAVVERLGEMINPEPWDTRTPMADRNPLTHDQVALAGPPPGGPFAAPSEAVLVAEVRDELQAGFGALADVQRGVSVFGSARTAPDEPDYQLARGVAMRLGQDGFAIITGGGSGIMEAANRGARDAASASIGLSIELPLGEPMNAYVDLPLRFQYFFTRKVMFVRYASAFLVFPGGFGTLDEVFELAALMQTGKVSSSPVVLVRRSYWKPLLGWLRDCALPEGKISASDLDLLVLADDEQEICDLVASSASRTEDPSHGPGKDLTPGPHREQEPASGPAKLG